MKNIIYFVIAHLLFSIGCKKDNQQMGGDLHPRIFDQGLVFQSPSRIIQEGESAVYSGLSFSPKAGEKTKITWSLNDEVVSTDTTYTFTPSGGGEYVIKLEATYNGQTATRLSTVLVSPATYTPKAYNFITTAYLSENGVAADVNWNQVTHVAFNGARVLPGGEVDFSKGNLDQNIDEIVARGHINGVPVLLGVTGRLSGIDGWSLYNSTDFGAVISNPATRANLVQLIAEYVVNRKIDGVDVMMTDLSNDVYDLSAASARAVGPFITELKAALPQGSTVTATVTTNYMHWEYPSLLHADWINVHAFENGLHTGPGASLGHQSPYSFLVEAANIWISKGYPANKLVLGMPAFGVRYNELDALGNNLSWGSYDYITFKDIVALDPSASTKEYTSLIAKGVYFNGLPLVTQKAEYIKSNGFKGAYLWAGDYDADGNNSLMNKISETLK